MSILESSQVPIAMSKLRSKGVLVTAKLNMVKTRDTKMIYYSAIVSEFSNYLVSLLTEYLHETKRFERI